MTVHADSSRCGNSRTDRGAETQLGRETEERNLHGPSQPAHLDTSTSLYTAEPHGWDMAWTERVGLGLAPV